MKQSLPKKDSQHQNNPVQCQTEESSPDIPAFVDNRQLAVQMRQLRSAMENSPQAIKQRQLIEQIHNSPRMIAQRQEMSAITGVPIQRVNTPDKEIHARIRQQTENGDQAAANALPQSDASAESVSPLADCRPETGVEQVLQAKADGSSGVRRKKMFSRKMLSTTPVIQGVFLPYEAPPKEVEAATLMSYLRLINFRRAAVERTMGENGQWFEERWKDLIETSKTKSVDQALGKVQTFIGAVLDKIAQNENMRKEILPWQDDGNIQERIAFYGKNLPGWQQALGEQWNSIASAWHQLREKKDYERMCRLAEAAAKKGGGDIAAIFEYSESVQHFIQELTTRQAFLEEKISGWAESWKKIKIKVAGHLKAQKEDQAHTLLEKIIEIVNLELKKTAEPKDVIRPMPEKEQKKVMTLFKQEIGAAIGIVKELYANDEVIGAVFQAQGTEIKDVKRDLTAVEAQLWEWRWQKKSRVILDKAGTAAAGGTRATANQRTGDLHLTRGWAEETPIQRQQTLIHEASHTSAVKTKDIAYKWGWAYAALSGKEKRRNADSYAEAAGKLKGAKLGLKELTFKDKAIQSGEKSSAFLPSQKEPVLNNPQSLELAKLGLGEMDRLLSRARTLSGNMSKFLKQNPENKMEQGWWEFAKMLGAPFTSVQWSENKKKIEYGVTNADLETLMMFRDSLKYVHDQINGVTQMEILVGAKTITINTDTLIIGQLLFQSIDSPEKLAAELIRQLYQAENPGFRWSKDVVPVMDKIVNMIPNWREIEPVLPAKQESESKIEPSTENAAAIKMIEAAVEKSKEWLLKFKQEQQQQQTKSPYIKETITIVKSFSNYANSALEKLKMKTRPELIKSNDLQELEIHFNDIGTTLASAKEKLDPLDNKVQWKQLKELGTIAHEVREAWIGRLK
ncbi:hypothetical protein [Nitrosomonas sp.]|uniref:hypothetical protein n=1 Tax=Nitrosomonas sp. TaxID=42353 RepID=UPI00208B58AC|nr:hypothetical protein [Nitrosomonas sp.]GJL74651.1 MAG: hypothetical protein NMNS02_07570 [Nitrosomonas sp.]